MNSFNPYNSWLGIDAAIERPSYYQLLRLPAEVNQPEKIALAADKAIAQVRSQRPGAQAAEWSRLLDEIQAAKACLLDPDQRKEYDRNLSNPASRIETKPVATPSVIPNATIPNATIPNATSAPSMTGAFVATPAGAFPPSHLHAAPVTAAHVTGEVIQPAQIGMPAPTPAAAYAPAAYSPAMQQPLLPPQPQYNPPQPAYSQQPQYNPQQAPYNPQQQFNPQPPMQQPQFNAGYGQNMAYPPQQPSIGYGQPPANAGYSPMAPATGWAMPQQPPTGPSPMAPLGSLPNAYAGYQPPGPMTPAAPNPYGANQYGGWSQAPPPGPAMAPPVAQPAAPNPMTPMSYSGSQGSPAAYQAPFAGPTQAPAASTQWASTAPMAQPTHHNAPPSAGYAQPAPAAMTAGIPEQGVNAKAVSYKLRKKPEGSQNLMIVFVSIAAIFGAVGVIAVVVNSTMHNKPIAENPPPHEPMKPAVPVPPVVVEVPAEPKKKPAPATEKKPPKNTEIKSKTPVDGTPEEMPAETMKKPVEPEKPKPTPPPEPPKSVLPTPADIAALTKEVQQARTALSEYNFSEADAAFNKLQKTAQLPEQKAKIERLHKAAELAKRFRKAVEQTIATLDAGSEIKLSSVTVISVVETGPNKIILREQGKNNTYTFSDLKMGVALKLGEMSLPSDADARLAKGAYVFFDKRTDVSETTKKDKAKKVEALWKEAELMGADTTDLMKVLSDTYDFEKDAPKT